MNRIKMILNLLIGKNIVVYNFITKEVLCIIGSDEEIITKRYDYDFIGNETCLKEKDNKVLYIKSKNEYH